MTSVIIDDTLPYTQSIATAAQTVFDTDWTVDAITDVVVYARATGVAANDVTQVVSSINYTVTLVGVQQTVRVTFLVGRTADDVITMTRNTPADRDNIYSNTNFTPSMLNGDFGRQVLMIQQNDLYNTQLTPRYNTSATIEPVVDTILPILLAEQSWRKNAGNTAFEGFVALGQPEIDPITFIVKTADPLVPAAQSLGALTTGILLNTVVGAEGTLSISAPLTSLHLAGIAANQFPYGTGVNTYGLSGISPFSRTILPEASLADWQTALGIPGGGGAYFAIANNLSEGVPATMRTNLGLVIGTNVQAYDATLQSLSSLGTMSDVFAYTTGVDTWAESPITALGRSLLGDATQADMNTTIGSLPLAGGTMTGNLILNGPATLASQAVTLSQLNSVILNEQLACVVATDTDLPTWTYDNGVLGVGATLTAPSNGASTFDGIIPTDGQRVLVLFQSTNPAWQGAYTIVQGTGGTPTVLTRATDWDQAAEMNAGDIFSVVTGTTYGASQWMFAQTAAITVGTTALNFTQLAGQGALLRANNLSDLPSPSTARTNLGLAIGTNVQAYDATLQSISALGTAANKMIYTTNIDTWAETDITALGRTLLADATASDMRDTIGASPSALATNQIFVGSAGGVATPVAMSGDATIAASGALTIAANAVTNAKLAEMATLTIKGNNTGGTTEPIDLTVSQVQSMLAPPWATYTPTITLVGGTGNVVPTFTTQSVGRYCRIGNSVTTVINFSNSSGGTAGAGTGQITVALPVTPSASSPRQRILGYFVTDSFTYTAVAFLTESVATIDLYYYGGGATLTVMDGNILNGGTRGLQLSFTYEV